MNPVVAEKNGGSAAGEVSTPGNLTTRELARALAGTPDGGNARAQEPGEGSEKVGTGAEVTPAKRKRPVESQSREGAKGKSQGEAEENAETQSREGAEGETAEGKENAEATRGDTSREGAEDLAVGQAGETEEPQSREEHREEGAEGEEGQEEAEGSEGQRAGLPEELAEAIAEAKAEGKTGTAKLLKRLHKLVDQRDTERNARLASEEERGQLQRALEEARSGKGQPASNGNGEHPDVAKVTQEIRNVDHWITQFENNPDGLQVPDGNGVRELNAEQVRAVRRDLERQRQELVARKVQRESEVRQGYAAEYGKHHEEAVRAYPWLSKPDAPERAELENILRAFPGIKQSPDYELVLGDFFRGRSARMGEAKTRGKVTANGAAFGENGRQPGGRTTTARTAAEPARVPTGPPSGGAPAKKGKGDEAEEEFKGKGTVKSLAKMFAAKRAGERSQE